MAELDRPLLIYVLYRGPETLAMPRRAAVANDVESTSESLAILAEYRRKGVRHSVDIVKRGERVLQEKGALKRMGEEGGR